MDIQSGGQPDRDADFQHFSTDGGADLFQKRGIPALGQQRFTGPGSHIAVYLAMLAGQMLDKGFVFLQPTPFPLFGKSVREAGTAVRCNSCAGDHIQPRGAVR